MTDTNHKENNNMQNIGENVSAGPDISGEKIHDKANGKVVEYVEQRIVEGTLTIGDKLPSERELSQMLELSRNSVREGIKILDVLGVISSQHGRGNTVTAHFDETLVRVLGMMFALNQLTYKEIREFRNCVESEAMQLAMDHADQAHIEALEKHLFNLENDSDESVQTQSDKMIHYTIVDAAGNRLISNIYSALTSVMESYISLNRSRVLSIEEERIALQQTHRMMVEAVKERNQEKGQLAMSRHYAYLCSNMDT